MHSNKSLALARSFGNISYVVASKQPVKLPFLDIVYIKIEVLENLVGKHQDFGVCSLVRSHKKEMHFGSS